MSSAQSCSRRLGSLVQPERKDWKEETTLPFGGLGSGQPPQDWGMALAKFLACAVPQFLQSGNRGKLLGLTRENRAIGGIAA